MRKLSMKNEKLFDMVEALSLKVEDQGEEIKALKVQNMRPADLGLRSQAQAQAGPRVVGVCPSTGQPCKNCSSGRHCDYAY